MRRSAPSAAVVARDDSTSPLASTRSTVAYAAPLARRTHRPDRDPAARDALELAPHVHAVGVAARAHDRQHDLLLERAEQRRVRLLPALHRVLLICRRLMTAAARSRGSSGSRGE